MPSSIHTSISSSTNGGSPHIDTSSMSFTSSCSVRSKRAAISASGTSPRSISHGSITSSRRSRSMVGRGPRRAVIALPPSSRSQSHDGVAHLGRRRAPRRARRDRTTTTGTRRGSRTAPRPRSSPSASRRTTAAVAQRGLRRSERARGVDAHHGPLRRRRRRASSDRPGTPTRTSKPCGARTTRRRTDRDITLDAIDTVGAHLVVAVVVADHVPRAVAQQHARTAADGARVPR